MADVGGSRNQSSSGVDSFLGIAAQGALPDHYNSPTGSKETLDRGGIPLSIPGEFLAPEIDPARGQPEETAIGVGVPEASVDEYHGAPSREHQIRTPGQSRMQPEPQATLPQTRPQHLFWPGIPAADAGHHP